jgi:hypothetical protein
MPLQSSAKPLSIINPPLRGLYHSRNPISTRNQPHVVRLDQVRTILDALCRLTLTSREATGRRKDRLSSLLNQAAKELRGAAA